MLGTVLGTRMQTPVLSRKRDGEQGVVCVREGKPARSSLLRRAFLRESWCSQVWERTAPAMASKPERSPGGGEGQP